MRNLMDKEAITILVVDDHEDNRFMLNRRLKQEGFSQIIEAENGVEAIEKLDKNDVDLMLLDLMMPIMDGFTVLEQMRKDSSINRVPVIMISADHNTENVVKGIELGAIDYLPKPFNKALLRARITATLEKKRLSDFERTFLEHHDSETGLANRKRFAAVIDAQLENATDQDNIAVAAISIPSLTQVGASHGGKAKQALMNHLLEILYAYERSGKPIGRISEDHFSFMRTGPQTQWEMLESANRLARDLMQDFTHENITITPEVKMGISFRNQLTDNADAMISEAKIALERADSGTESLAKVFDPEMQKHMREAIALQTQLKRALENGEFELYVQPILDMVQGKFIGGEALIRWNCPEQGLVPPFKFIPAAEESGLIMPMGEWIIEEGFRLSAEWNKNRSSKDALTINLNVSPRQFSESDLIGLVNRCHGKSADAQIKFEVTESALLHNPDKTRTILQELKQMGIRHAMDDFGTGYSSLSYLHQFPFDTLKIDQAFVRNLSTDPTAQEIVRATIAMAHALALDVVAEGIENAEDMSILMDYGCDFAQGYFLGKPMPAADFSKLIGHTF